MQKINDFYLLGIETSCDETSVSLYKNNTLIDEITASSMRIQSEFGGVVPEIATRYHQSNIHKIFSELIKKNNIKITNITHIAYTAYPGLPGCLHIAECFAKTLSNLIGANLIPINHLYGHLFSGFIDKNIKPIFPLLGLVVSGGHTTIYLAKSLIEIEILNETQDDAVGEVLDKVARALGWPYPGGPIIDKNFDIKKANLLLLKNNFSVDKPFSFSGLKTAALNYINVNKLRKQKIDDIALASTVQKIAIDDILNKSRFYLNKYNCQMICLGGGVSANNYLRTQLQNFNLQDIIIPNLKYTGDQATMIAFYALLLINAKILH